MIDASRPRASETGANETRLRSAVSDVVGRQKPRGIELPGDVAFGKPMGVRLKQVMF